MNRNEKTVNYWSLDKEQVLDVLGTSKKGLSAHEINDRKKIYGDNIIRETSKSGPVRVFFEQFLSPLIWILVFAGMVTGYLGEIIETVVIFSAAGINIFFAFYQEYKAENTIEQLKSYIKNRATVLRDGVMHDIDAQDLVVGDVVSITYGNRVPADGRIIEATNVRVDESILTGESLPSEKNDAVLTQGGISERKNSVFCGTYVTQGVALFVVTAIGNDTEIGKIVTSVTTSKRAKTPVQNAVRQISWYIFLIALVVVVGIFILGISRGESVLEMLVLSAAVAVGAVPEALPMTLTVILSVGVLVISKKGGLIRKLDAAETLGSATLILTDKTGTLTKAELTLDAIYSVEELLGNTFDMSGELQTLTEKQREFILKTKGNIQATVEKTGDDPLQWVYVGGAFDVIILKSMYRFGIDPAAHHQGKLTTPFSSSNKYSVSLHEHEMVILGAPDILIKESRLSHEEKEKLMSRVVALSEQGKRLVALGTKPRGSDENTIAGLGISALFEFSDPLREEVVGAISDIQSKGVSVKIITGDMVGTARVIARKVGISVQDHEILTGEKIKNTDDDGLKKILPRINLFARTTPEDKLRIGNLYRELGEVVAMTGDGVNDAPALKAMDIGISLGSASDVAKSSADMILLDNNFKTISDTIIEGHKIKSRIQKVFVYLMSNSLDEVFVIAGSLIAGLALPLTALQIIWVNILTGTLPALAFAYDTQHSVEKDRKYNKIFNFKTKVLALGIGTVSSALLFALYALLHATIADDGAVRAIFFTCFSTYILTVSYSFRNFDKGIWQYNPFSNMKLNTAVLFGLILIVATVTLPVFERLFSMTALPLTYVWIILVWNIGNLIVVEAAKWVMRK